MRSQEEYVLRTVEERGIRFVQLWFTDVLGTPKTFSITPAELENALVEGMTFDGSAIDGFSRVQESDVLARPDPNTFQLLPWHGHGQAGPTGEAPRPRWPGCSATSSTSTARPSRAAPATCCAGPSTGPTTAASPSSPHPEIEYFYFADGDPAHPPTALDSGSYFELTVADRASDIRQRTVLTLEEMGIPVEHAQHEDAPSQHEIDLRYTDALTMADTVMTVRLVVKEMARQQGVFASFMPKPLAGVQGSGMHTHMSLFRGRRQRLRRRSIGPAGCPRWPRASSPACLRHARRDHRGDQPVGQLLQAAGRPVTRRPSTCPGPATTAPPWSACRWSSRASSSRPGSSTGHPTAPATPTWPSPSCWPPASEGIEKGYELPPEADANLFALSPEELANKGILHLPGSLNEALGLMESSELLADTLGEHVFEWFIRNKRAEWAEYKAHVTQFELDRYLPLL